MMPLYPYQERVFDALMEGKPVILQAPTGAGKTRAALYPFLRSWEYGDSFPRSCIYAVPMRVLASQFHEEYAGLVKEYGFLHPPSVTIQTGEHRHDDQFEGNLIFATIDQVLSSFLMSPYSLPRRLSNLNAGAVASSYLVFDEFHLFEPTSTLPTTLEALKMLKGVVPFLMMTATFSEEMLGGLAQHLDAVVIPEDVSARREMQAIPSQEKTRYYHICDDPLDADTILRSHSSRTLVVCNVVDRARHIFHELRTHSALGETQVLLLHSRFLAHHRREIEEQIRTLFEAGNCEGSWIAVATQTIEVGLNITCQVLHTELAPANAILQRAGRCARYRGEVGHVHIYTRVLDELGESVNLTEQAWPYQDQREVIHRTAEAFAHYQGKPMTFEDEQQVVGLAHGPVDRLTLLGLEALQTGHCDKMRRLMDGQRTISTSALVRAVSSQLVTIHDNPEAMTQHPFSWETFSLHPGTVQKYVSQWENEGRLANGAVCVLNDSGDVGESGHSLYEWKPVSSARETWGAALILVHPNLAGYDNREGLLLGQGTDYRSQPVMRARRQLGNYSYRLESYATHIGHVLQVFRVQVWPQVAQAAARLARALGWEPRLIERAAYLVVLLHDTGKLSCGWQRWVEMYQARICLPITPGQLYAHTDFDPGDPNHLAQQHTLMQRPPHAVEGATAVIPLLVTALEGCEPLVKAAFTAIARHHGAFTKQGQAYQLAAGALAAIGTTLQGLPEAHRDSADVEQLWMSLCPSENLIKDLVVDPGRRKELLPYMLLARILRLSDQKGTRIGTDNYG